MLRVSRLSSVRFTALFAATLLPVSVLNGGELMYATDAGSDALYLVDIQTGAVTPIGPAKMGIGATTPVTLAVNPQNGRVYIGNNSPEGVAGLLEVNRNTGIASHIGGIIRDITFDSQGTLYTQVGSSGGSTAPGPLGTVDISTGHATSLGGPDLPRLYGMAFNPADDHLYGMTTAGIDTAPTLVKFTTAGAISSQTVMSQAISFPGALVFDGQGTLVGTAGGGQIFDIDPATGAMSNFRNMQIGFAAQGLGRVLIPEPPSIALVLSVLASFACCVRRRSGSLLAAAMLLGFIPTTRCALKVSGTNGTRLNVSLAATN